MAFTIGTITYTISRIVAVFSDANLSSAGGLRSGEDNSGLVSFNTEQLSFNDQELSTIFEQIVGSKNEKQSDENARTVEENKESDHQEVTLQERSAEIYENVTITEHFLKYTQDFGDLYNLRQRSNFVLKAAKLKSHSNMRSDINQKDKVRATINHKLELQKDQQKKVEELKMQEILAKKHTARLSEKLKLKI